MTTATRAYSFLSELGVNTHLDSPGTPYENTATVEQNLNYLGLHIIRDAAGNTWDIPVWQQVSQATGYKFDDVMMEGPPSWDVTQLSVVPQLVQTGVLFAIEGCNEEDDSFALQSGNSLGWAAWFQQQVWAMGQQYGLPVINMSFGQGWSSFTGNYGTQGDLSSIANYGNAHTYPQPGNTTDWSIQRLNADAKLAASQRPVITTEIGWPTYQYSDQQIATYGLDAVMDGLKDGDAGMYFYALYDDPSGPWGMFNSDGSPRPIATAIHNLTTLLSDHGGNAASFTPGSLNYSLSGTQSGDNSVLIEKSDGSFWLSLWNESAATHTVSLSLPVGYHVAGVFDPLNGTQSQGTSTQISVTDHPILVEITDPPTNPSAYASNPSMEVGLLYEGVLGRLPDAGGLNYWASDLQSGADSLASIAAKFMASGEFHQNFGYPGMPGLVTDLYNNALGRAPDASGAAYWQGQTPTVAAVGISESQEALNLHGGALIAAGLIH